jgi:pyrimidine operon attenuation protein/uracil phosphoribosyltransferase
VAGSTRRAASPAAAEIRVASQVMGAADVRRVTTRIAHEILERNRGAGGVALVGLQRGGVWLAERLAAVMADVDGLRPDAVPVGVLDVSLHRDDIGRRPVMPSAVTRIPPHLEGLVVVLVDDVLFTGRTVRAALDALGEYGRPRAVQLAVLIDRGHRELPIRPDYVGKNLPTRRDEAVEATPDGVWIEAAP